MAPNQPTEPTQASPASSFGWGEYFNSVTPSKESPLAYVLHTYVCMVLDMCVCVSFPGDDENSLFWMDKICNEIRFHFL